MNSQEAIALEAIPSIPRDEDGVVFAEPWQAEAFAMALILEEGGFFTWSEWAETLGAVIREMPEDTNYYHCWFGALERLVLEKQLVDETALATCRDIWDQTARATPHGEPIEPDFTEVT